MGVIFVGVFRIEVKQRSSDTSKEAHEVQFRRRKCTPRTRVGIGIRADARIATNEDGGAGVMLVCGGGGMDPNNPELRRPFWREPWLLPAK